MSEWIVSSIGEEELQEALLQYYTSKGQASRAEAIQIRSSSSSTHDEDVETIRALSSDVDELSRQLEQKTTECSKALASIQTFHHQQKQLFDEFVLLRSKYDDQRASLTDILWTHCGQNHPELKEIPIIEDEATFVETEDRVGSYAVGGLLGEGQYAIVRSCRKEGSGAASATNASSQTQSEWALKIIKKERILTFSALKRVANEITILHQMKNPHIVSVVDVIQTRQKLYIVTEKGGTDLFEFFDEHPDGVSESWAKEIIVCVMKGVLYCHEKEICHRDLKPENILVTFDTEAGKCVDLKLCDFGLAVKSPPKKLLTDFCGSPGFFAPEMIIRGTYFGDKVDIWSTGCILLELILGHERFCDVWMKAYDYEVLQDKAIFTKEITATVARLPEVLDFSDELSDFIIRMLKMKSTERPAAKIVCTHAWLEGKVEVEFRSIPPMLGTPIGSRQSSGVFVDTVEGAGEVDPEVLSRMYSGVSERERHLYEQHNKQTKDGEATHQLHLPPIEPQTPSVGHARKILSKGADLAKKATKSNKDNISAEWKTEFQPFKAASAAAASAAAAAAAAVASATPAAEISIAVVDEALPLLSQASSPDPHSQALTPQFSPSNASRALLPVVEVDDDWEQAKSPMSIVTGSPLPASSGDMAPFGTLKDVTDGSSGVTSSPSPRSPLMNETTSVTTKSAY